MLDSEFVDQFFNYYGINELNEDQKGCFNILEERLTEYNNQSEFNVFNSCTFFTRLLTKIETMENRIKELEELLEITSYNLGELEVQVHETGVYMEDW